MSVDIGHSPYVSLTYLLVSSTVSDSTVRVTFTDDDDGKVYNIQWVGLLTEDGMPLSTLASPGMKVLAPWSSSDGGKIDYSPAIVCVCDEGISEPIESEFDM